MKYYIEKNNEKLYLDKIEDGFIVFKNTNEKIDLATIKKVYSLDESNNKEEISITQYLMMTDQLKEGNEWEVNKWLVYFFFSIIGSIINCMFAFVGVTITYYTIPLFLISAFCCWQLKKINKKKMAIILFVISLLFLIIQPIGDFILQRIYTF